MTLASMCENPATRVAAREVDIERSRWRPWSVTQPMLLSRCTDVHAWLFIADSFRAGVPIACRPPSVEFPDHAYIMVDPGEGTKDIYMKVVIRPPAKKLIGVSFHYGKEDRSW